MLKNLTVWNRKYANIYDRKFYSILHTGGISKDALRKIMESSTPYEIMVHPGYPKLDQSFAMYDENEKAYRISPDRLLEFQALNV